MTATSPAPGARTVESLIPVGVLGALAVLGGVAAATSPDARGVMSLAVPHLGGTDGPLLGALAVLRVAVLSVLVGALMVLASLPLPGSRHGRDVMRPPRLDRVVQVGRVAAVALFLLALLETFGARALAVPDGASSGAATAAGSHLIALAGSVWAVVTVMRPADRLGSGPGWAAAVVVATHLPLALLGSWLGQPDAAQGPAAVVSRAAWLLAVVLTVGPAVVSFLAPSATKSAAAAPSGRRPHVVPVLGVLAGGYGGVLAVSAAEVAATTAMLVVALLSAAASAAVAAQRERGRANGLALAFLGVLAAVLWLVLPPPASMSVTETGAATAGGGAVGGGATGMDMSHGVLQPLGLGDWFTTWAFDPLFAPMTVVAVVLYVAAVVKMRRRGHVWPLRRTASWCLGWVLFAWATSGAPAVYGMALFSMHMVQHMTISMAVPAFLVLAAPISLAFRALSPAGGGRRGPREWLLTIVHSRVFRLLAHPLVAPPFFVVSLMVFYYSPLFVLAMSSYAGHVIMTLHFLLSGYLFAWVLVGIDPGPTRPPYPLRLMILIITMAFHAFFGIVLMSSDVILAEEWFRAISPPWVDLAQDQYVGGALAWGLGDYPVAILSVALALAWLRDDDRERRRYDRQADRDGDAALTAYNSYLQSLDRPPTPPRP